MGVPVSPRNIFPSNIQGLPTWYEVRVCEQGWLGRRGGIDMMVAMNPQTWDAGRAEVEPGGYLFYDSTRPLPPSAFRSDITVIGMPVTAICNATYEDPRQRTLFKNIMVLGALSVLMDIEPEVIEKLFGEQYKGKERLLEATCARCSRPRLRQGPPDRAARPGHRAEGQARQRGGRQDLRRRQRRGGAGLRLRRRHGLRLVPDHAQLVGGRGLPAYCKKYRHDPETGEARYAIVQAEDEIASIGMVTGAGWNGARPSPPPAARACR
jgi:2-oxoglutarate ferredoxin oxidoreductase subunit alpha